MKTKVYVTENGELVAVDRKRLTRHKVLYTWVKAEERKKKGRVQVMTCVTLDPPHKFNAICLGAL